MARARVYGPVPLHDHRTDIYRSYLSQWSSWLLLQLIFASSCGLLVSSNRSQIAAQRPLLVS
jgi:hypothetical protein